MRERGKEGRRGVREREEYYTPRVLCGIAAVLGCLPVCSGGLAGS